jgi:sulfate adenylyltransferase
MIAILHVEDVWQPDRQAEGKAVFKSTSIVHPGVAYLMNRSNPWYVGGRLEGLQLPSHYDFKTLRQTPAELRSDFANLGWRRIVAFQTRNPMHRAHVELTFRAAKQVEASLLIPPVVGMTKPAMSITSPAFVATSSSSANTRPARPSSPSSRLPCAWAARAKRSGTPSSARNYGCTHLIVGRDHAGPGKDSDGKPFYGPYDAQETLQETCSPTSA